MATKVAYLFEGPHRDAYADLLVNALNQYETLRSRGSRMEQALGALLSRRHKHLYQGYCPDELYGPDSRDSSCPACAHLLYVKALLSGNETPLRAALAEIDEWEQEDALDAKDASASRERLHNYLAMLRK